MGYQSLINKSLKKTFNLMKDLKVSATFRHKVSQSFDFSTSSVSGETLQVITTDIVVIKSKKTSEERNPKKMQIMFQSSVIPDLLLYDEVIFGGFTHKVGPEIASDGFISLIEVFREV